MSGLEHRLVLEQRQVRVEDRRVGLAGARRDDVAVALDRGRGRRRSPCSRRVSLARRVLSGAVRRRRGGAVQMVGRADREPGRGGDAGEDVTGGRWRPAVRRRRYRRPGWLRAARRRWRRVRRLGRGRTGGGGSGDAVAEALVRQSLRSAASDFVAPEDPTRSPAACRRTVPRGPPRWSGWWRGPARLRRPWRPTRRRRTAGRSRRSARPAARAGRSRCGPRATACGVRPVAPGAARSGVRAPSSDTTELRALHRERAAGLGGHLLERRATARRGRGRHRPLDQRRLAQHHPARRVAQQVDRELGAHQRAPEIHQHQHPIGGHRPLDRRHARAWRRCRAHPARRSPRRPRAPGPRHPSRARARPRPRPARRCARHDHDPDHVQRPLRARRRGAGNRSGGPIWTPVAWVICQRQVSLSHATSAAPESRTWPNRSAPTAIAMSYFSALSP